METLERNHSVGSPPRVREKLYGICKCLRRCRITPACAGKTAPIAKAWSKLRDHPRVCGKNLESVEFEEKNEGSPPRVREKQRWRIVRSSNTGITPACAGKTYRLYQFKQWYWDHPRVCGKNPLKITSSEIILGSPPRVREKH